MSEESEETTTKNFVRRLVQRVIAFLRVDIDKENLELKCKEVHRILVDQFGEKLNYDSFSSNNV